LNSFKIPLLDLYVEKLNADIGEFSGYLVPMKYTNSIEEALNVRNNVGFFDVSHMGRLVVKGGNAIEFLEYLYTKRISDTKEGFMSGPTLILTEKARVRDDEMLYRVRDDEWLIVVNAPARFKIIDFLRNASLSMNYRVEIEDYTEKYTMIAIQGPGSLNIMEKLGFPEAASLKPLEFRLNQVIGDTNVFLISRSGWTGEDGFELWLEHSEAADLVEKLVRNGVKPAGLIARDMLRMEMGYVLHGAEYGEDPSKYPCAIALRYGFKAIDWSKKGFLGENALRECRRSGVDYIRVGLKLSKKAGHVIPRSSSYVYVDDVEIGWVTSGAYSPVLERGIAQAYVKSRNALFGEEVEVEIRGKRVEAKIVDFPFIEKHRS